MYRDDALTNCLGQGQEFFLALSWKPLSPVSLPLLAPALTMSHLHSATTPFSDPDLTLLQDATPGSKHLKVLWSIPHRLAKHSRASILTCYSVYPITSSLWKTQYWDVLLTHFLFHFISRWSCIHIAQKQHSIKSDRVRPGRCGSVGWSVVPLPKGCRFDSWSEHVPRLQVQFQAGTHAGGNQSIFLSLPLPLL